MKDVAMDAKGLDKEQHKEKKREDRAAREAQARKDAERKMFVKAAHEREVCGVDAVTIKSFPNTVN